jgi:hypothetical protein
LTKNFAKFFLRNRNIYHRPVRETLQAIKDWTKAKNVTDIEFRDNSSDKSAAAPSLLF